jgi:hypothetical protein
MFFSRRQFLTSSVVTAAMGTVGGDRLSEAAPVGEDEVVLEQRIPIRHAVDVFVAGGGPAGVAAAVTAARQGKRVFLAEANACLGGMATAGMLPIFMQFTDGEHMLAAGIGAEIQRKLIEAGGTGPNSDVTIRAEVLKRLYDDLLLETNVTFTFQTRLIAVQTKEDRVASAILAAKSGLFAVTAKMYIDCTGDGDLAAWAGAPHEKGDAQGNVMPGTLCSLWANVDWKRVEEGGRWSDESRLTQAFKDKVFACEDRHLPGMSRVGETLGGGNIGHVFGVDATDERSITKALIGGRQSLLEYEQYYKKYLKGFEQMELAATASQLGLRESRRIIGDYVLNLADFKSRAVFDDEIGRYCYPVDIHASTPDAEAHDKFAREYATLRYNKGESYGIPYRILVPRGLSNVLVAGRCVSSDRYIQGSIRVQPGCFITGQAAGAAAALAVDENTHTRGFPVAMLQKRLKGLGAYLPNFGDAVSAAKGLHG